MQAIGVDDAVIGFEHEVVGRGRHVQIFDALAVSLTVGGVFGCARTEFGSVAVTPRGMRTGNKSAGRADDTMRSRHAARSTRRYVWTVVPSRSV